MSDDIENELAEFKKLIYVEQRMREDRAFREAIIEKAVAILNEAKKRGLIPSTPTISGSDVSPLSDEDREAHK